LGCVCIIQHHLSPVIRFPCLKNEAHENEKEVARNNVLICLHLPCPLCGACTSKLLVRTRKRNEVINNPQSWPQLRLLPFSPQLTKSTLLHAEEQVSFTLKGLRCLHNISISNFTQSILLNQNKFSSKSNVHRFHLNHLRQQTFK